MLFYSVVLATVGGGYQFIYGLVTRLWYLHSLLQANLLKTKTDKQKLQCIETNFDINHFHLCPTQVPCLLHKFRRKILLKIEFEINDETLNYAARSILSSQNLIYWFCYLLASSRSSKLREEHVKMVTNGTFLKQPEINFDLY